MKRFIKIWLVILVFLYTSCCSDVNKALPDLIVKSFDVVNSINNENLQVDQVINLAITVSNVVEAANECTQNANQHKYNIELYWSETGESDSFELVGHAKYFVPTIKAGGKDYEDKPSGTPNKEGFYYFKSIEDTDEEVTERNESNNEKDAEIGEVSSSKSSKIFYVKPNLEFEEKMKNIDEIEYFTFHQTDNLVEYHSKKFKNE